MKRTVALLRVSTKGQDPARQRVMLEKWAAYREIPLETIEIRDEGHVSSGSKDRKVLDRLMADVRAGRVGLVVVSELDRLGRGLRELVLNWEAISAAGAKLMNLSSGREFDPSTPEGKLEFNMLATLAQYLRDRIRQQTASSLDGGVGKDGVRVSVYGKKLGRPKVEVRPEDLESARKRIESGETVAAVAVDVVAWKRVWDEQSESYSEEPVPVSGSSLRRRLGLGGTEVSK